MSSEQIIGLVISLLCCWGCSVTFLALGLHAEKCEKPVNFWAGAQVDSRYVSDIGAYNHENAVMWKLYAIPFGLAGILLAFDFVSQVFTVIGVVVLFATCFPGLLILIRHYRKIEKKYVDSKMLDKIDPFC